LAACAEEEPAVDVQTRTAEDEYASRVGPQGTSGERAFRCRFRELANRQRVERDKLHIRLGVSPSQGSKPTDLSCAGESQDCKNQRYENCPHPPGLIKARTQEIANRYHSEEDGKKNQSEVHPSSYDAGVLP